jgi:hypothetical protein
MADHDFKGSPGCPLTHSLDAGRWDHMQGLLGEVRLCVDACVTTGQTRETCGGAAVKVLDGFLVWS